MGILQGQVGAKRDIVLMNAAAALVVADRVESLEEGLIIGARSIDSGAAFGKLEALRMASELHKEELLLS